MLADWLSPCPLRVDARLTHRSQSLRHHQQSTLLELRQRWQQGQRHLLVALPTGAGKTRLAAEVTRFEVEAGRRVLWLLHRGELLKQTEAALRDVDLGSDKDQTIGLWWGETSERHLHHQVYAATVQTLTKRRNSGKSLPAADMLVVDEAHHYTSEQWHAVLACYPHARRLMLSATPERADGVPLFIAEHIIAPVQPRELIASGCLVPCAIVGPKTQLDSNKIALTPRVAWEQWASGRRTLVFCQTKQHAKDVAGDFKAHGITAAHIDEDTSTEERQYLYGMLQRGEMKVITNVYVATEGLDVPEAEVCVVARSVSHVSNWRQMIGRVLRASKHTGKTSALVLDLNGLTHRFGSPEDDRYYRIDGSMPAATSAEQNLVAEGFGVGRAPPEVINAPMTILRGEEWISRPSQTTREQKSQAPADRYAVGSPLLPNLLVITAAKQISTGCEAYGWSLVKQLYTGNDLLSVFEKADQQYFERFGQAPSRIWAQAMANILASVAWIGVSKLPAGWPVKLRDAGYFMTPELRGRFARGHYNCSLRALLKKLA